MKISSSHTLLEIFCTYNFPSNLLTSLWFISNIQIVCLLIVFSLNDWTKTSFSLVETVSKIIILDCNQPDLMRIYEFAFWMLFIYVAAFGLALIFTFILYRFGYKSEFASRVIKHIAVIHQYVLFVPIVSVYSLFFEAYNKNKLEYMWIKGFQNYSEYLIIAITGLVLNFILGIMSSIFSFISTFGFISSRRPSFIDSYKILTKSCIFWLYIKDIIFENSVDWVVSVLLLIVEVGVFAILYYESPYFSHKSTNYMVIFSSTNIAILAVHSVYSTQKKEFTLMVYWIITFLTIFLSIKDRMILSKESILKLYKAKNPQGKSIYILSLLLEVFEKASIVLKTENNDSSFNELIFNTILADHSTRCQDPTCFCKIATLDESTGVKRKSIELSFNHYAETIIRDYWSNQISKSKKNTWLKITFAEVIVRRNLNLFPTSFTSLISIHALEKNIFTEKAINNINDKIQNYLHLQSRSDDREFNISKFIEYQKSSQRFQDDMHACTKMVLQFWDEFQTETPNLTNLYDIATKSNKLDASLRSRWPSLKSKYEHLLIEQYIEFAAYSIITRNSETEGYEILKEYQNRIRNLFTVTQGIDIINMLTINSYSNVVLTVCMERSHLGIVKIASGDPYESFGYTTKDIKGSKINMFMPSYVNKFHDSFVLNHLQTGKQRLLYKNHTLYCVDRDGYCLPVNFYACPSPNLDLGFTYVAILRPILKYEECLILNKEDEIVGFTRKVAKELDIVPNPNKVHHLSEYFSKYEELKKVIFTCQWIKTNIPKDKLSKFNYVKHQMIEHKDFLKIDETNFHIPDSETDYEFLIDFYMRLHNAGLTFKFTSKQGILRYNCRLVRDHVFDLEPITFMIMTKLSDTYEAPSPYETRKRRQSQRKINEVMQEIIKDPTQLVSPNLDQNLPNYKAPLTRGASEKVRDNPANDQSVKSVSNYSNSKDSIQDDNLSQSQRSESVLTSIRLKQLSSRLKFNYDEKHKTMKFSKFAIVDAADGWVEKKKGEIEQSFNEKSLRMREGPTQVDKAHIFTQLIEYKNIKEDFNIGQSVSSVSRSKLQTKRIEKIINTPTKDYMAIGMRWFYLLYYGTMFFSMIGFNVMANENFDKNEILFSGLTGAADRYNMMFMFNKAMKKLDMMEHGYLIEFWPGFLEHLENQCKQEIRAFLDSLEISWPLIKQTYPIVPYKDLKKIIDNIEIMPVYDQISSIFIPLDQVFGLYESNGLMIIGGNAPEPDVQYDEVIDNAFNGVLISSEQLIGLIQKNIGFNFLSIVDFFRSIVIVQSIVIFCLIIGFMIIERSQTWFRRHFFESLIRLEDKKLNPHLRRIHLFYETSMSKSNLVKKNNLIGSHKGKKETVNIAKPVNEKANILRKKISNDSLHKTSMIRTLMQASIFLLLFVAFIAYFLFLRDKIEMINASNDSYVHTYKVLGEYYLVATALDNYVTDDEAELRQNLLREEIWHDIKFLKNEQTFYRNLALEDSYFRRVIEIVNGNICARYQETYPDNLNCLDLAGGSLVLGMDEMNSFLLQNVIDLIQGFERTPKAESDIHEFYNQTLYYVILDILDHVLENPYLEIASIIHDQTEFFTEDVKKNVWISCFVCLVLILIFGTLSSLIANKISSEKFETKRILNLVPITLIVETPMIAKYVKKDTVLE